MAEEGETKVGDGLCCQRVSKAFTFEEAGGRVTWLWRPEIPNHQAHGYNFVITARLHAI